MKQKIMAHVQSQWRLPLFLLSAFLAAPVHAVTPQSLYSPTTGVLCDRYACANDQGLSRSLTARYLGKKAAKKAFSQGDFNVTVFTFANGVFCDTKERLCRKDRYFGTDGKRSGEISRKYTAILFSAKP